MRQLMGLFGGWSEFGGLLCLIREGPGDSLVPISPFWGAEADLVASCVYGTWLFNGEMRNSGTIGGGQSDLRPRFLWVPSYPR